ncbi:MAG: PAS domain-containing protein [Hydrogenophaga sp.]|nr:PAS domain-containing protein [Hydrogenophaga sp.]
MGDNLFEIDDLTLWLNVLEKIVDTSTNMVVVTGADRRIKWVNATYTRVTGWELQECVGKHPKELLHGPDTSLEDLAHLRELLRDGRPVKDFELINYRKSGEPYRVRLNIEDIRDDAGEVYAYLAVQSDVTDWHQAQLNAIELRQRLQSAQRLARLGSIDIDAADGASYWSSEVFRIVGMAPDHRPRTFHDLLAFADREDVQSLGLEVPSLHASGKEVDVEFRVQSGRGRRWIRCRGFPVPHQGTFLAPVSWSIQDITLYKSRLEEKHLLTEKLNGLVQARTRMLEESNQALEDFSYALSHDLRTPLRHVASFAELIAEELRTGDREACLRYSDKILQCAHKMQELINGMLSFAQLGRQGLSIEPVEFLPMVREAIAEVEGAVPDRTIEWDIDQALPCVPCDRVLMRAVWTNLLDNAVKYSSKSDRSQVRVRCQPQDDGWEFTVKDNGAGFDPQYADRLFGMFQRLHRDDQFKGTGVGLAVVRRIIESHGGRIWAASRPGEGASFHFVLPQVPGTAAPRPTRA